MFRTHLKEAPEAPFQAGIGKWGKRMREEQCSCRSCRRRFQHRLPACPELTQPPSARLCQPLPGALGFTAAAVNVRAGRPHWDLSAERQALSHTWLTLVPAPSR